MALDTSIGSGNETGPAHDTLPGLRAELGLTRSDFARMVGLSDRAVAGWEGGQDLKPASIRTIVEVARLRAKIAPMFASTADLGRWLKTPNDGFDGSTPIQVIERGEIDRLWRMIHLLESGAFS